jgi:hypothetical protein
VTCVEHKCGETTNSSLLFDIFQPCFFLSFYKGKMKTLHNCIWKLIHIGLRLVAIPFVMIQCIIGIYTQNKTHEWMEYPFHYLWFWIPILLRNYIYMLFPWSVLLWSHF